VMEKPDPLYNIKIARIVDKIDLFFNFFDQTQFHTTSAMSPNASEASNETLNSPFSSSVVCDLS
jgi:hypothetical protein